jgi:uncharacterized protein YbaR (Trm112 family)
MHLAVLDFLRCPFCGTRLALVENEALVRQGDRIDSGVLGCECCAFPIVDGIPVLIADDLTRDAMHTLEAGHRAAALEQLLGLEGDRLSAFRALDAGRDPITYRKAIEILSPDPEGTYFIYHFSDPTFLMAQAIVQAVSRNAWTVKRRVLDVCGGSGHLTRVLMGQTAGGAAPVETVLADVFYWKLWLAARITSPGCTPVCCDANNPLPFTRDEFSMVVLLDAFPYIWQKRMLASEMMRVASADSVIVMPHLHSSLGENFAAGMPLTPAAYRDLFEAHGARLFSDRALLNNALDGPAVDLSSSLDPDALGDESSLTLIASPRADVFRAYEIGIDDTVTGELAINPLYRVERRNGAAMLTLAFPTPEYEEEFGECRRYLPDSATIPANPSDDVVRDLRRKHVLLDVPRNYL